jgi:outer membrane receptor protein involved in Fe transport
MYSENEVSWQTRRGHCIFFACLAALCASGAALAQDAEDDDLVEEIVTVGTQIKGANIADALAVSVVTSEDIEAIGVTSGDELLDFMAEQGSNFQTEAQNTGGGVNAARGDNGAFNLRNIGTGNTLVLLNGRRMVNEAAYQTEVVGGSFIPVNTVNSQAMPVAGMQRVEVLRDGASAIYGADAVAGVVNYVLKTDFEGFAVSARYEDFEGLPRSDEQVVLEWGNNFNDGRTNLSVFASFYHRDAVAAEDDRRWADSNLEWRLPADSPWLAGGDFDSSSANSEWGQFDIRATLPSSHSLRVAGIVDGSGEFQMYPVGNENCEWEYYDSSVACGNPDNAPIYRYNLNEKRDLYSDLDRFNVFAYINHEFGNGLESFTELSFYRSTTTLLRGGSTRLSAVENYRVGAGNYYNPFGAVGSPYRYDDPVAMASVPDTGYELVIDNYRWVIPRVVDNDSDVYRILQGLRGQMGSWDWEAAATWSRATRDDITHNRVSNTLIQEALNDSTPAAYNPFVGRENSNIERALIDVYRKNETDLKMVDFKMSRNELFEMPAGPVGIVTGLEYREESFVDDRDPRLDGTIVFTDNAGTTFPDVSDVMNSSPTLDSKGDRDVFSAFAELQVPLLDSLDAQFAVRYEDFSDIGDTTVGKVALGWRPIEQVLFRGSWSEAYRVPNLVTVNEAGVARSNTVTDYVCEYVNDFVPEGGDPLECRYGMQRTAGGSDELVPERSTNTSFGVVFDINQNLTVTLDYWQIEKDDTIGLFGEANHTALDLLYLLDAGDANCASVEGNPAIIRDDNLDWASSELEGDYFEAAGICPVGQVAQVNDVYKNLDTRNVRGHDIGVYFNHDTAIGEFDVRYVAAFLDKYDQVASGPALTLLNAKEEGILPLSVPVEGFASLIRQGSNPREKQTLRVSWRKGDWRAAVTGTYVSDVINPALTLNDGTQWILDSMQTYNASVDYRFDAFGDTQARIRLGVINMFDERAPLDEQSFGYNPDMHRDLPRSWYLDLRLDF